MSDSTRTKRPRPPTPPTHGGRPAVTSLERERSGRLHELVKDTSKLIEFNFTTQQQQRLQAARGRERGEGGGGWWEITEGGNDLMWWWFRWYHPYCAGNTFTQKWKKLQIQNLLSWTDTPEIYKCFFCIQHIIKQPITVSYICIYIQ